MRALKLTTLSLAITALVGCSTVRPLGEVGIKDQPKESQTIVKAVDQLPAPAGQDCSSSIRL